MGQGTGKIPDTDVTVHCGGEVTEDIIKERLRIEIRRRGDDFATSSDADYLRAACRYVTQEHSWVKSNLQLAVYGKLSSWTFYSGNRSNQVAFYNDNSKVYEPTWQRKGWKLNVYNGVKIALNYASKALLALAGAVVATNPIAGGALAIGGVTSGLGSELM